MVSTASSVRPDAMTSRGIMSVGAAPFIYFFYSTVAEGGHLHLQTQKSLYPQD